MSGVSGVTPIRACHIIDGVLKIPLGKDAKHGYALVDADADHITKLNWTLKEGRYAVSRTGDNKIKKMQWLIMPRKEGYVIDHINGVGIDNRRSNLRYATHQENLRNVGIRKNNSSGFTGVSYRKDTHRYAAYIANGKDRLRLGCYDTAKEAGVAYNNAAVKLYGQFARLNEIKGTT